MIIQALHMHSQAVRAEISPDMCRFRSHYHLINGCMLQQPGSQHSTCWEAVAHLWLLVSLHIMTMLTIKLAHTCDTPTTSQDKEIYI